MGDPREGRTPGDRAAGDTAGHAAGVADERFVICGDDALAVRIVEALARPDQRSPVDVVVVAGAERGPQLTRLRDTAGVRVVVARADAHEDQGQAEERAFREAGVAGATAVALVDRQDVTNINRALRVQEIDPTVRVVVRSFTEGLGARLRLLLPLATVLSVSSTAATSFVVAAIGRATRQYVRLPDRSFVVAARREVAPESVVCGLAHTAGALPGHTAPGSDRGAHLLPEPESHADLVLARATTTWRTRRRRGQLGRLAGWRGLRLDSLGYGLARGWARVRGGWTRRLARAVLALVVLLVVGTMAFATVAGYPLGQAVYLTVLDAAGAAQPDLASPVLVEAIQAVTTVAGIALIPLVTAVVVDSAFSARVDDVPRRRWPRVDHVVVVGLGDVGLRIVETLRERGVRVIGVDRSEDADGLASLRRAGVPVIVGDGTRERTLRDAAVAGCRALVVVGRDDLANLQTGLVARSVSADVRVVLRMRDDDLARRLERSPDVAATLSVSAVAAPVFASAMREGQVAGTIPVGRRVLLVADVVVAPGSDLVGETVGSLSRAERLRVLGVSPPDDPAGLRVRAADDEALWVGRRVLVVATRDGLAEFFSRNRPV